MKIKFKHQQFQLDAVKSIVDCFEGQPNELSRFTLDRGRRQKPEQMVMDDLANTEQANIGFKNNAIQLIDQEILKNIQTVQRKNGLKISEKLEGKYNLTIEMETGTGKTYTYIRTMFELYQKYGWSKFIVVVPSIAIREGVLKTFQITEDHFMSEYGTKARYFVYNSKQLHHIEKFASDAGINVMIINSQAFNARGKDARRIYMELDDFNSRRPIDVLASTNPILIIDEPQSVEGKQTKESLKAFHPLFTLRYSATHREDYNKVYRLDALDAYNKKLVKKISVKGISAKGTSGTNSYLYLEGIDVSTKQAPVARLEFEVKTKTGLARKTHKIRQNDDIYQLSGELEQYKGYKVSEINGQNNSISFINGVTLYAGDVQGDVGELHFRRIQIRETIKSHFEKERALFHQGIKVLSLFFIDEVAKYRQYDKDGSELNGVYAEMFEEEYTALLNEQLSLFADDPYIQYLNRIQVKETHKGYFSIDKKSNRYVDPKVSARETDSDDADAYDLIMRDKERLLSFSEPTRFIFSHSALKEGWDNPNVFQICTLKHSDSTIKKRQEVGRGLRLCVNQNGERMDSSVPGIDVHEINVLTVIASESYEQFAKQLQNEIAETLSDRPRKADRDFFLDKVLKNARGEQLKLEDALASKLLYTFIKNDYVDDQYNLTDVYFNAVENQSLKLPEELTDFLEPLVELVKSIYVEGKSNLADNERNRNIASVTVNNNFYKKEFQELWNQINRKSVYTVKFDSEELVKKCVWALDSHLQVPAIRYAIRHGEMNRIESQQQLKSGEAFQTRETKTELVEVKPEFRVKYDLVGKLMDETRLTRKTIVAILTGIKEATFLQFRKNPEEFMLRAAKLINEQKATTIIESITYDVLNDKFEADVFTKNTLSGKLGENAIPVEKHVYDYVVTDSKIERAFAKELDVSNEVRVYAKLPRGFFIPTPMGNYNPDWAIVFKERDVKHIYFIAETKGSMESMELREVEKAKIECARKHFAKLNSDRLKYDVVNTYEKLFEIVKG
ncbi:MAG: DEAD/DEAH box helicase family protein [Paenibacillus macerans]|uniref:type III restriction-modification system endonuclease n=1 Tax=Paenibacillus TaxID=44249 RepID=UPI000EE1A06A|nr:DEAD/DEAH box helicase family protein [Paenibacillus macerans]MDU7472663.1 DEAD/DEAH box helicase family protein [Paenibacillus macerans]GBK62140.1 type III restriction endonuclease subunit R [Paenibacillus macerans]GBK68449.1 type III restriction endonuclease subunit R [Paenibacillus macerans]